MKYLQRIWMWKVRIVELLNSVVLLFGVTLYDFDFIFGLVKLLKTHCLNLPTWKLIHLYMHVHICTHKNIKKI